MQSSFHQLAFPGIHVACIMDGNGRWAKRRNQSRSIGHRAGIDAVRRAVESAPGLGIGTLTLYAFSADNWKRPDAEVSALMKLLRVFVRAETARLKRARVRVTFIGRRDRLPSAVSSSITRIERETSSGDRLHLRIAVDYAGRDAICDAAAEWARTSSNPEIPPTRDELYGCLATVTNGSAAPEVDLLIRTGGEQRLSDFLLWESAYAELYFLNTLWPDLTGDTLADAVAAFHQRDRRFGGLTRQTGS